MQKIDFSGAVLNKIERTAKEGRAHFSAFLNDSIEHAMEWQDLPDCAISAKLEGDITGQTATLVPAEKELKHAQIDFTITGVSDFSVVRLNVERTKNGPTRKELRFVVTFTGETVCALLESYMVRLGEAKAKLTISYTEQAKLVEEPAKGTA